MDKVAIRILLKDFSPTLWSLLVIVVLTVVAIFFEIYRYPTWIDEGGIVENISVLGYIFCAFLMCIKGGWQYIKKYHYFVMLVIIFALRELDFDKKFTTMGLLKTRFYISDQVPFFEKIIGFFVIVVLSYIVLSIFFKHVKNLLHKIKIFSPTYIGALIIFLFIVFVKSIDGIGRKLEFFNVNLGYESVIVFEALEEVLEMGIPLLIASLFIIFIKKENINPDFNQFD